MTFSFLMISDHKTITANKGETSLKIDLPIQGVSFLQLTW